MNKQEVFNKVYIHLLTQNAKSMDNIDDDCGYVCAYRGENGLMCAVGCLITDEAYDPEFENLPVERYEVTDALEKSGIVVTSGLEQDFLMELQNIHDNSETTKWKDDLQNFAHQYALTIPEFTKETE